MGKAAVKVVRGRGRPAAFEDRSVMVDALNGITTGENLPSRYLAQKLVAQGLVAVVTPEVENRGRGRPAQAYTLTGVGRSRLALMRRNLEKAAAKAVATIENATA